MEATRIALYARTMSHLKAKQIAYFVLRRLLPVPNRPANKKASAQIRRGVSMQAPLAMTMRQDGANEFRFLNVAKTFRHGMVDWACPDMPKLWRYNLHYFDYILDAGRSVDN